MRSNLGKCALSMLTLVFVGFRMFASVRTTGQAAETRDIKKTDANTILMTPQLTAIFKKSLKSNRWDALDLGAKDNYTHDNMVNRWVVEKNKWLQVSSA